MIVTRVARATTAGALILVAFNGAEGQAPRVQGIVAREWSVSNVKRTGFVAAPTRKDSAGAPLVLVFHGHGGTAANMARSMNIHVRWPEALVIYLQGLPTSGKIVDADGRRAGWQSAPGMLDDRDLKLVDTVLAWAKRTYRVDAKRVFATGHSNGGWFTYVLWASRPDQFTAFAPASAVFGPMITGAKPKPAFIIAGRKDRLVPFALQQRSINSVLRLNDAAAKGEPWFGAGELHRSKVAEVVTYVYPGAHPLPPEAAPLVVKFFQTR